MNQPDLIFNQTSETGIFFQKAIFSFFIVIFGLIGLVLLILSGSNFLDKSFALGSTAMLSGGITSTVIVLMLFDKMRKGLFIKELRFNYQEGFFQIEESNGYFSRIPLAEITGYHIRIDNANSGSEGSYRDTIVYFQKNDGAWIDITWYDKRSQAEEMVNRLQELSQSTQTYEKIPEKTAQKKNYTVNKPGSDIIQFKWKDRSGFSGIIGLLTVLSFLVTFSILVIYMETPVVAAIVFFLFLSIFWVLLIYGIVKRISIREYVLEANLKGITYGFNTLFGFRKKLEIPWEKYSSTQVNILREDYIQPQKTMWILTKDMREEMNKRLTAVAGKDFNVFDAFTAVKAVINVPKAEFPGYSYGEVMSLELELDQEIENRFLKFYN